MHQKSVNNQNDKNMNNENVEAMNEAMKCLLLHWYEKMADNVEDRFLNTVLKPMLKYKRELLNK